jgi:hypothetical protein
MAVFGRVNTGFRFPNFDEVPPRNGSTAVPIQTVDPYEAGDKMSRRPIQFRSVEAGVTYKF